MDESQHPCSFTEKTEEARKSPTSTGSITRGDSEASTAEFGRARYILTEVDLAHNLLHLSAFCRPHVDFVGDVAGERIPLEGSLEACHDSQLLLLGRDPKAWWKSWSLWSFTKRKSRFVVTPKASASHACRTNDRSDSVYTDHNSPPLLRLSITTPPKNVWWGFASTPPPFPTFIHPSTSFLPAMWLCPGSCPEHTQPAGNLASLPPYLGVTCTVTTMPWLPNQVDKHNVFRDETRFGGGLHKKRKKYPNYIRKERRKGGKKTYHHTHI